MEERIDHGGVEIYFDGVESVRLIEGLGRVVLFSGQNSARRIVARLIAPSTVIPDLIQMLTIALAEAGRE